MSKVFTQNFLWMVVLLSTMAVLWGGMSKCSAAIVATGNVEPDVGTWTYSTVGYVGRTSDGGLVVDAGSILQSKYAYIAYNSGVSGTATITGAGSKWINDEYLIVGDNGAGTLRIEAGGQVSNNSDGNLGFAFGSSGTATVTGAGSKWTNRDLSVGYRGTGTLRVEAGGQVTSSWNYLGYNAGSCGSATVTGAGSKWTNSEALFVGNYGSGTLNIEAGGQVSSPVGHLGFKSGSSGTATITGAGSVWTISDSLYVGEFGSGTLRVEAGGQVSNSTGNLGYFSGSSGMAAVTGTGSKWTNSSELYVGRDGAATLTVADGGEVTAQTLYASLASLSGNGTITAQGTVLDADLRFDAAHGAQSTVTFGSGGTLIVNAGGGNLGAGYKGNGSLTIAEGVAISSPTGYLGYCSGSSGTATVTGAGAKWNNSKDLYVGRDGTGTLTVADGGEVTAQTLYASLGSLYGNGMITATKGAVLDADLRFDAAHPAQAILTFGSGGILTVNAGGEILGAGYKGNGSLNVAEGVTITGSGYLGYYPGSSGTATVTGAGSKWTNRDLYVGYNGTGTLRVEAGGQVTSSWNYLGYNAGSCGSATVTGAGSKWTNSEALFVGNYGSGTLNIEAGGQVSSSTSYLSSGTATVRGPGSMWTNSKGLYVGCGGTGTLRIEAGGQVSSSTSNLGIGYGSSGTATVIGVGSKWTNSGVLYVGNYGSGALRIEAGGQVSSSDGYLGYDYDSSATATITGAGSMWTNSGSLYIGNGVLRIEAGGQVNDSNGYLGYYSYSSGTATVTGAGSMWANSGSLSVGSSGRGTLHIRDGGVVTANSVSTKGSSILSVDVGYGSSLRIGEGTGSISNAYAIRILTGPQPVAGSQYSPIAAGTWSGSGIYQALGGTWNLASHVFTVSPTLNGVSGMPVAINRAQQQRVLVEDAAKDWTVGVSLLSITGTGNPFDFTATAIADTDLTSLSALLKPGQSVLSGWNLTTAGSAYISLPAYLSLSIPTSLSDDELQIWRLNSGKWSSFSVSDLTAHDGYASFTVTGLSGGYAVTAAVPEPGMMVLLACGMIALAAIRR